MGGCSPLMSGVEIRNWVWNQLIKSFVMFEMSSNESQWWAALKVSLSASSPLDVYSQWVSVEEIRLWIASSSKSLVSCCHCSCWRLLVVALVLVSSNCEGRTFGFFFCSWKSVKLVQYLHVDSQIKCQIRAFGNLLKLVKNLDSFLFYGIFFMDV